MSDTTKTYVAASLASLTTYEYTIATCKDGAQLRILQCLLCVHEYTLSKCLHKQVPLNVNPPMVRYAKHRDLCRPVASNSLLLMWIFVLSVILTLVADRFFCPALEVIADFFQLPANVAGATLLSFGNGAPDVFTQLAAVATVWLSHFHWAAPSGTSLGCTSCCKHAVMLATCPAQPRTHALSILMPARASATCVARQAICTCERKEAHAVGPFFSAHCYGRASWRGHVCQQCRAGSSHPALQGFVDIEHKAFMRDCSFYTGGVVLLAIVAWDAKARTHLASHVRGCVCILAHRMQAWHRYIKFALEV
jgi:Sodium/calcium exchanger protein